MQPRVDEFQLFRIRGVLHDSVFIGREPALFHWKNKYLPGTELRTSRDIDLEHLRSSRLIGETDM